MDEQYGWYFTAPWDPVSVRRGDAFGFRAAADYFAELLAPGLSNSTFDARWISILSWCLQWSDVAWRNAGGGDLSRRDDQRARYAWLRPLELLWVDRTLQSGQTTGQLRGRRSIERWRKADRRLSNFAMSPDQFRRYRQVGMYGAYRVVLRTIPGLTTGDGWTPDTAARALANLVNDSLPHEAGLKLTHFENGTRWGNWSGGGEARFWEERGWKLAWVKVGGILPTADEAIRKRLPEAERRLLEPALFGAGSTRRITAEVLASAKDAKTHADLCDVLANSSTLSKRIKSSSLALLPDFTRFTDAAMSAMRELWNEINQDAANQAPTVEKLARSRELRSRLDILRHAGADWLRAPNRSEFQHQQVVTHLAESMRDALTPAEQLRVLARHHDEHGGGRRWFREQAGKVVPLVKTTDIAASDYRFRLRPICLLAAQCGVANMNAALDALAQHASDDEEGDIL
ncbi:hypothetical protein DVT68_10695 [Dyella solisilvae]|uniref:Uncharacterized protein n=1 Tax=Dyella solisilvae TaxID=1920168 RepID=A0A370K8I5_9GAMM|nr:hypothetical protein [Dyella solisilvae]RDI98955.1 hypothetical protein DVT68_10695 [Dyella solisilvae]